MNKETNIEIINIHILISRERCSCFDCKGYLRFKALTTADSVEIAALSKAFFRITLTGQSKYSLTLGLKSTLKKYLFTYLTRSLAYCLEF